MPIDSVANIASHFRRQAKVYVSVEAIEDVRQREIATKYYKANPDVPTPTTVYVFSAWSDVANNPGLTEMDCVFVDGTTLSTNLDLGNAIVLTDDGIRRGYIFCGRFHAERGKTYGIIVERVKKATVINND